MNLLGHPVRSGRKKRHNNCNKQSLSAKKNPLTSEGIFFNLYYGISHNINLNINIRLEGTKKFIEAIKVPDISGTLETNVVENRGRNGIYFCEILALDFATWLDVDFKVWIYRRIQDVLFGKAKNVASKISEAEQKKLNIAVLTDKVRKLDNEDVNKLLLELDDLKKIENERKKAVRQFSSQYKMF